MNESLTQFMAAVKANDLTRMGELWGTEHGPAAGSMDSDVLRRRITVIQKYLEHRISRHRRAVARARARRSAHVPGRVAADQLQSSAADRRGADAQWGMAGVRRAPRKRRESSWSLPAE